jgi:polysaccharide biosynthesis transport protein
MTLSQYLVVLRARWKEFLAAVAIALLAAALLSLLMPRKYGATASVLVDIKTVEPLTGAMLAPAQGTGFMATQMDLLRSERVLARAAKAAGLLDSPDFEFREDWMASTKGRGSLEAFMLDELSERLDVRPTRESGVITLAYTAASPAAAALVVNAVMQSYIDTTLELRLEPARNYNALFDTRAREARAELESAQNKVAEFQQRKGLIVSDERMDLESTRLSELSSQLVALQGTAAESGSRQRQAALNADRMPEVLNSPVVSGLQQELSRQQARLSELTARLGDQHPQMLELKANVAQLQAQIERESRKVSGSVGVNNAVNTSRIAQLRTSIEEQRAKVLALRSARDEASLLLRDVQNAQRTYDAVLSRVSQSTLETQNRHTDVSVLKRATPPAMPTSPRVGLNLSIGLVLGALVGMLWVMLHELHDRRLRTADDIESLLNMNLLIEMPRVVARAQPKKGERALALPPPAAAAPRLPGKSARKRAPANALTKGLLKS